MAEEIKLAANSYIILHYPTVNIIQAVINLQMVADCLAEAALVD